MCSLEELKHVTEQASFQKTPMVVQRLTGLETSFGDAKRKLTPSGELSELGRSMLTGGLYKNDLPTTPGAFC